MSESLLSISQAAEACGISAKSNRSYEGIGLIPKATRHNGAARTGGNRLYGDDDLRRLHFIGNSRALGLGPVTCTVPHAVSDGKPGRRYFELIREAAHQRGLPAPYIAALDRVETRE